MRLCFSLLFTAAVLSSVTQANGEQILHYTFDNGATDVSAHGYNGTIIGSPTVTTGQTGYALSFDNPYGDQAATQYVMLPDLTSLLGQSSFTIAIKYKSTDSSGYNGRLFGNTWVNNGLCLNINSPTRPAPNGCLVNGSNYAFYGNFNANGTPVTTDGQWHRAVLSVHHDMQTAAFYIDGNPVSASAFDFFHNTSFANLAVGANGGNSGYGETHYAAKAVVDDVQIFNNWMSQTAVGQITDKFPTNNNPANQIRFNSYSAADTKRTQLINSIWSNGLPTSTMPTATTNISFPTSDLNGVNQSLVASVDRLDANVSGMDFHSKSYLIHPTNTANANKVLIVHQGHQDGLAGGLDSTANKALQEGYTVIAMQMPLCSWNTDTTAVVNGNTVNLTDHNDMFAKLSPTLGTGTFKMFLEPVVQNINYFKNQAGSNSEVIMTGISGGGWTTHLAAAVDTRINLSVPVAGSAPLYSRNGFGDTAYPYGDAEQWWDPLYNEQIASDGTGGGIATWEEIYALGGYGFDRRQIMVTNLYDSVCFSGTFADSFKDIVAGSVTGLGFGDWDYYRETDPNAGHTITANVRDNVLFSAMDSLSFMQGDLMTAPEPSTAMLSLLGVVGMIAYAWRKRRNR